MAKPLTTMERLLAAVEMDPNSGCWLWSKAIGAHGYGVLRVDGKTVTAHRLSWLTHRGEIDTGLCVLHRCDVRACCSPDHLFLGTRADNMADMIAKGRDRHDVGERASKATISASTVLEIRSSTEGATKIAKRLGVAPDTVWAIRARRTWRHL